MDKAKLLDKLSILISSVFYVGYLPGAPGTFGSLIGIFVLAWWNPENIWIEIILLLLLFKAGVWASERANHLFKKPDAPYIVVDEFIGVWITLLGFPKDVQWLTLGFVLFRVFDILKPPPANYFNDKVKTGFGVVMDDVIAGVYAHLILRLVREASILNNIF